MTGTSDERSGRRLIRRGLVTGLVAGVVASGALVGCSSTPDSTADQGPIRPSSVEDAASSGGQAQATYTPPREVPGADKPFPNLADVPERPAVSTAEQRAKLEQALVADLARRRYSGDVIVLQGPVLETPAPTAMPPPPPSLVDAASAAAPAGSAGMTLPSTSASAPSMDDTAIAAVPATPSLAPAEAPPPAPALPSVEAPPAPTLPAVDAPPAPTLPAVEAPTTGAQRPAESALPSPAEQFLRAARETSENATESVEGLGPITSVSFADGGSRLADGEEDSLRDIAARYGRTGGSVRVIGRGGPGGQTGARARADAVAGALARLGVPEASIAISAEDVASPAAGGEGAGGRADIYLVP